MDRRRPGGGPQEQPVPATGWRQPDSEGRIRTQLRPQIQSALLNRFGLLENQKPREQKAKRNAHENRMPQALFGAARILSCRTGRGRGGREWKRFWRDWTRAGRASEQRYRQSGLGFPGFGLSRAGRELASGSAAGAILAGAGGTSSGGEGAAGPFIAALGAGPCGTVLAVRSSAGPSFAVFTPGTGWPVGGTESAARPFTGIVASRTGGTIRGSRGGPGTGLAILTPGTGGAVR